MEEKMEGISKKIQGRKQKNNLNNFRKINGKKAQGPRRFKPGKKHNIYIN